MIKPKKIVLYRGRPLTEMSKEELIEALEFCAADFESIKKECANARDLMAIFRR